MNGVTQTSWDQISGCLWNKLSGHLIGQGRHPMDHLHGCLGEQTWTPMGQNRWTPLGPKRGHSLNQISGRPLGQIIAHLWDRISGHLWEQLSGHPLGPNI